MIPYELAGHENVFGPLVVLKPEMVDVAKTARIDSFCKIEGGNGVTIGEFVHIASFCHLNVGGGTLVLEDHCGCSSHCCLGSGSPDWSYLYVSAAEPLEHHHSRRSLTRICAYAVLFMGVVVVPGVTIGEGAIIKPGSIVYDDVKPWTIMQGNPAIKIGNRKVNEDLRGVNVSQRSSLHREILRPNGHVAEGTPSAQRYPVPGLRLR